LANALLLLLLKRFQDGRTHLILGFLRASTVFNLISLSYSQSLERKQELIGFKTCLFSSSWKMFPFKHSNSKLMRMPMGPTVLLGEFQSGNLLLIYVQRTLKTRVITRFD